MGLGSKNQLGYQEFLYDFSVDGGAAGFIDLSAKAGYDPLDVGSIVKSVTYKVHTAMTSGGAATVAIGNATTADKYLAATAYNNAAYADENAAAANAAAPHAVNVANDGKFGITIATAALTAGKISFIVEFYKPRSS